MQASPYHNVTAHEEGAFPHHNIIGNTAVDYHIVLQRMQRHKHSSSDLYTVCRHNLLNALAEAKTYTAGKSMKCTHSMCACVCLCVSFSACA